MAAIQWAFLVVPLIDWPLAAWRHTRSRNWTAVWFAGALVFPLGFPIAANAWQEGRATAGRAQDKAPTASAPLNGTILISGDCGAQCTRLVRGGTVDRLLHAEHHGLGKRYDRDWQSGHYRSAQLVFASTYCDRERADRVFDLRDQPGWCLVERTIDDPKFSAVIHFEGYYGTNRNRGRRRIEVWRCDKRCRLVARQTEFKQRRFAVPLRIAYPGGSEIDPQFARIAVQRGDADPARVIEAALGLAVRDGPPRPGEDPDVAAREAAAFRAAEADRKAREEADRLARLAQSNQEREAQLAQIARDREIRQRNRALRSSGCETSETGGVFRSVCKGR
jgi:hypothetical protein